MATIVIMEGRACGAMARVPGGVVVRVAAHAGRFVPHQLIRAALPAIRQAVSAATFAALVAPARAALSVVFAGLREALSADERALAASLSGRLTSHLTHNVPMQELLWAPYARLLRAAHAVAPLTIIVDDLRHLDGPSFAVLVQVFRDGAGDAPDLIAGHTLALAERVDLDARGLAWDIGRADVIRAVATVAKLAPGVTRRLGDAGPCGCAVGRDGWDGSPERVIAALLERPAPDANAAIAPALIELAASFAFDAALRLAIDVLDGGLALAPADRALIHGVAALAAHNRQFFSQGNLPLAGFLGDSYRAALAGETDPARRIAWHYRLAVTQCRRLGDLAGARATIDAGLAALADASLAPLEHALQAAWLHNIDALLEVRRGDRAAAFTCCERSYAALAGAAPGNPVALAEVELAKLVIGENALTLASMTGDEPRRERWLARGREGYRVWPSLSVVEILEQQRIHIDRLEIAEAFAAGRAALELAQARVSLLLEYFVLVSLSDLAFRLADYDAAALYGDRARDLAPEIGDLRGTGLTLDLRAIDIADARGRLDDADHELRRLVPTHALSGDAGEASAELRVELTCRLAAAAARRGDRDAALAHVAQAIDLAADAGELDLLLRASCVAGDVARQLDLREDAETAYASCLALLDEPAAAHPPAREVLRLRAVAGLSQLGDVPPAPLARCLARLPRLLVQERDAWPPARVLLASAIRRVDLAPDIVAAAGVAARALATRGRPADA